jgi:hypothetical protein
VDWAGAAYVYTRTGTAWSQQAYVKASNTDANDWFGGSVALSSDGSTLVVGAYMESSLATGVNGDQTNNGHWGTGAVYKFKRAGGAWSQEAYLKSSNTDVAHNWAGYGASFGRSVALSSDGSTLAVGAPNDISGATGIGGDENDHSAGDAGAVHVF